MCPVCFATAGWIAASAASTGGIAALVLNRRPGKNIKTKKKNVTKEKR